MLIAYFALDAPATPLMDSALSILFQRINTLDIVRPYVQQLQQRGKEYVGLCPFHTEHTPSFHVNAEKAVYHCFGCGAQGSILDFFAHIHRITKREAVIRLAEQYHVTLPTRKENEKQSILHKAVETCCTWFEDHLHSPLGAPAKTYLLQRGITEATIRRFRLGYAPSDAAALHKWLRSHAISEDILFQIGVIATHQERIYTIFRNRIIFPIFDAQDRVTAFGGRLIEADPKAPKYLNSPETPLFKKRDTLYHAPMGLAHIRQSGKALIAEGYLDVIALAQAGWLGAVAPLGTSVTETHLTALWHIAPTLTFCLDGDTAGQKAMHRVAEMALPSLRAGNSVSFALLPSGEDPDSLLQKPEGKAQLTHLLDHALPLSTYIFEVERNKKPLLTPEAQADFEKRLYARIHSLSDDKLKTAFRVAYREMYYALLKKRPLKKNLPIVSFLPSAPSLQTYEQLLICLVINYPFLVHNTSIEIVLKTHVFHPTLEPLVKTLSPFLQREDNTHPLPPNFHPVLAKEGFISYDWLFKDYHHKQYDEHFQLFLAPEEKVTDAALYFSHKVYECTLKNALKTLNADSEQAYQARCTLLHTSKQHHEEAEMLRRKLWNIDN